MSARRIQLSADSNEQAIRSVCEVLRAGGVVIYPTDTIYGIGADATDTKAVERVFDIKGRDRKKPLLLLADSATMVLQYTEEPGEVASALMKRCWPGPVTIILRAAKRLPPAVTGGTSTIGFRVPAHKFSVDLVRAFRRPIVSTSANLSGDIGGTDIDMIAKALGDRVELIVDAGSCASALPSTLVDATGKRAKIIRQGSVTIPIEFLKGND